MSSQAKIDANRRNARKSTGPRTPSGKAVASMNAVKHGLSSRMPVIPGENESDFRLFAERWINDHQPEGPMEEFLVERLITTAWRLRRVGQMEAGLLQSENHDPSALAKLSRYEASLERSFYRALKELRALQEQRAADSADGTEEEELQNEATGVEVPAAVLLNRPPAVPEGLTRPGGGD